MWPIDIPWFVRFPRTGCPESHKDGVTVVQSLGPRTPVEQGSSSQGLLLITAFLVPRQPAAEQLAWLELVFGF